MTHSASSNKSQDELSGDLFPSVRQTKPVSNWTTLEQSDDTAACPASSNEPPHGSANNFITKPDQMKALPTMTYSEESDDTITDPESSNESSDVFPDSIDLASLEKWALTLVKKSELEGSEESVWWEGEEEKLGWDDEEEDSDDVKYECACRRHLDWQAAKLEQTRLEVEARQAEFGEMTKMINAGTLHAWLDEQMEIRWGGHVWGSEPVRQQKRRESDPGWMGVGE